MGGWSDRRECPSMPNAFCHGCNQHHSYSDDRAGKVFTCTSSGYQFILPKSSGLLNFHLERENPEVRIESTQRLDSGFPVGDEPEDDVPPPKPAEDEVKQGWWKRFVKSLAKNIFKSEEHEGAPEMLAKAIVVVGGLLVTFLGYRAFR